MVTDVGTRTENMAFGGFRYIIEELHSIRVENQQFFERFNGVPKHRSRCRKTIFAMVCVPRFDSTYY